MHPRSPSRRRPPNLYGQTRLSLATGVPFRTRKSPLRQRAFVKFCQIGKKQLFQPVRRPRYSGEKQGLAIFDGASNTIEGVCVDGIQLQRHPGTRSYFLREVDQWETSTLATEVFSTNDYFQNHSTTDQRATALSFSPIGISITLPPLRNSSLGMCIWGRD